jgi:hypothetical protein
MKFLHITLLLAFLPACLQYTNSVANDELRYGGTATGSAAFLEARAVLQENCFRCHAGWSSYTEAQFSTTRPSGFSDPYVTAGDLSSSLLYYRIRGSSGSKGPKTMPDDGSRISSDELAKIEDWILNYSVSN